VSDKRDALNVGGVLSVPLLIFGIVGATGEYRHRTIAPAVLIAPGRLRLTVARLIANAAWDTRDDPLNAKRGSLYSSSLQWAPDSLGSQFRFVKYVGQAYRFQNVNGIVLASAGRLGLVTPLGGQELYIGERFFAGGSRDLRGFGFEEAGPTIRVPERNTAGDIIRNSDGTPKLMLSPLGGNAVLIINNELRFPIWRDLGGAVFSDTGNVFQRVRDMKPSNLTQTFGLGVRVKTPVGPVRFDIGFLVFNKPPGYAGYHLHFTIGQTF
jgi:outer membrane protein insertion porin family